MTKERNKNKTKINLRLFNKILFIVILIGSVYYITGTNDLAVKGFKLQELKKQAMDLNNSNNELELKTMSLSSYNNLDERVRELSMVPTSDISYISSIGDGLAKK